MLPWLSSITDSLLPAGATAAAPPVTLNGKSAQLPSDWAQKVDVVYQMPDVRPQGVLALFHGCAHSATDFWPQSDRCPECRGLPVEVRITRMALQAGWMAHGRLAFSWPACTGCLPLSESIEYPPYINWLV